MSFLAKVEARCDQNDMSLESSLEFKQAVIAKYKILEKIKSVTKSALKKATIGLVGLGLFSSALMANPTKTNNVALKYQNSIQQLLKSDGSDLTVNAQAKKLGENQFVLKIKILDKESKDYAIIKITKLGGTFQDVELRTNPGSDGDLDEDVEMWGQELYDSWATSVNK